MTQEEFCELKCYCDEQKIGFLSTPFDLDSIDFLEKLNIPLWKNSVGRNYKSSISGKNRKNAQAGNTFNRNEYNEGNTGCIRIFYMFNGCLEVTVLHCNTEYPTAIAGCESFSNACDS